MVPFRFRRPHYFWSDVLLDACRRRATDRFYGSPDKGRAKARDCQGFVVDADQEAGGARGWKARPADFR